jgi:CubicO group peptidase (beta-lactamase class C family)
VSDLLERVEPGQVGLDAGRLTRLDRFLCSQVDRGRMPGYLLAVARHGRLAHLGSYGRRDVERDLPVELGTVFRVFSMSKPVVSVAAMSLYEKVRSGSTSPSRPGCPSSHSCVSTPAEVRTRR